MNQIIADRRIIRANAPSVRQILLNIHAPSLGDDARRPVNIAIALDTSESMEGDKLRMAKLAIIQGLGRLGPQDGFAFVNFARDAYTVVSYSRASPAAIELAKVAIESVWSGGVTNLGEGLLHAYEELKSKNEDSINRCLILTDGLANRGITETNDFLALVKAGARRKISTSTIGMGNDYDDYLMRKIALAGRGNFYRARRANEIAKLVDREFGESLQVTAGDVKVRFQWPAGIVVRVLSDYETIERPGNVEIALGDLVSGQITEIIVELDFDSVATSLAVEIEVQDADGLMNLGFTAEYIRGTEAEVAAQVAEAESRFRVSQLHAALATREAVMLNRWKRHAEAQDLIMKTAQEISERAAGSQKMLDLSAELKRRSFEFRKPMPEPDRKDWTSKTSISCRCVIVPVVKRPPDSLKLVQEKPRAAKATLEID